jgi:chromosome segregation ATPase
MALSENDEGALGCLIGVIVLVFAAIGFTVAADKLQKHRNRAAESIPEIRDQEDELIALSAKEQVLRKHLDEALAKHTQTRTELAGLMVRADEAAAKLSALRGEKQRLESDIQSLEPEIRIAARNLMKSARSQVMRAAIPVLQLNNGRVYRDARITAINDDRIRIQHAEGSADITSGLLEPEFRTKLGLKPTATSP